MMANNKLYESLPNFLGGKRKLLKFILPHLAESETIADVFMGGGSVSLACKWLGKRVIANDIAYRSRVIGKSIIANDTVRLVDEDIYSLFVPSEHNTYFVERNLIQFFTLETARLLDVGFANARTRNFPVRELLEMVLYKFMMNQRQFGGFGHNADIQMIASGKAIELLEQASPSRGTKVKTMLSHPLPLLLQIKNQVNAAICQNEFQSEFHQMDCFDFLEKMRQEGRKIDVLYLDSPYKDSLVYSSHYKILDSVLEGKLNVEGKDKTFNKSDALESFERLFASAMIIPKWVVSMGFNPESESGIKGEELLAVVQKFRPAKLHYLKHNWAINNITATKNHKAKSQGENVEYLIVTE